MNVLINVFDTMINQGLCKKLKKYMLIKAECFAKQLVTSLVDNNISLGEFAIEGNKENTKAIF
jgi:hypothetical protein